MDGNYIAHYRKKLYMKAVEYFYPEVAVGGYTQVDGLIEFYGRINALLDSNMTVLDFGSGSGRGPMEDPVPYRRALRTLKGKCARVIGIDIDVAVLDNPFLDEALALEPGEKFPLDNQSVDFIVSDATFEHITDPKFVSSELDRILRPGGWICARTPNRWGYIALGATLLPNKWHAIWLKRLQPQRKEIDVFPTMYKLNTKSTLNRYFPYPRFRNLSYGYFGEPAYFGQSKFLWGLVLMVFRLTPGVLAPMLMVFIQKQEA